MTSITIKGNALLLIYTTILVTLTDITQSESSGIHTKERLLYGSIHMNDQPDKTNPSDINLISICLGWGVGWGGREKKWAEKTQTQ